MSEVSYFVLGRFRAWVLVALAALLLSGCETEEETLSSETVSVSVSANDYTVLDLPSEQIPAGSSVKWQITAMPASGQVAALFPWDEESVIFYNTMEGQYEMLATITYESKIFKKKIIVTALPFNGVSFSAKVANATTLTLPAGVVPAGTSNIQWEVVDKPAGGDVLLSGVGNTASFTGSVEGEYILKLTMSVSGRTLYRNVKVLATSYATVVPLAFDPVDAQYSQSQDLLLLLDKDSPTLYAYSLAGGTLLPVTLPVVGNALAVSEDGLWAVVGHDGSMSLVNLLSLTVQTTVATSNKYSSLVLTNAGVAVGVPGGGSGWTYFDTVDLVNGTVANSSTLPYPNDSAYPGSYLALAAGKIYYKTEGLSPADISRMTFSGGIATTAYDSIYHGDHDMCGKLWMYEDGSKLVNECRTVFTSTDTQATDILYSTTINDVEDIFNGYGLFGFSHSTEAGKFLAIPADPDVFSDIGDTFVQVHDAVTMARERVIPLPLVKVSGVTYPTRGRWVFFNGDGSNHVVVIKAKDAARHDDESLLVHPFSIAIRD